MFGGSEIARCLAWREVPLPVYSIVCSEIRYEFAAVRLIGAEGGGGGRDIYGKHARKKVLPVF